MSDVILIALAFILGGVVGTKVPQMAMWYFRSLIQTQARRYANE